VEDDKAFEQQIQKAAAYENTIQPTAPLIHGRRTL